MNGMTGSEVSIDQAEKSRARSQIYALLAMGFRYPDENTFKFVSDRAYVETLVNALATCAPSLLEKFNQSIVTDLTIDLTRQEMEALYICSFETNTPSPSVSLYEGSYLASGDKPSLLLELKSFYRNFGLAMAEMNNELEDALTAELEFMQFLSAKQAVAETGVLDRLPYLRAQRDFLQRHLADWLPAMKSEINNKLKSPFFTILATLAVDFIAWDAQQLAAEEYLIAPV
jgi:DMSO reductase family type II enzyme chaperone